MSTKVRSADRDKKDPVHVDYKPFFLCQVVKASRQNEKEIKKGERGERESMKWKL